MMEPRQCRNAWHEVDGMLAEDKTDWFDSFALECASRRSKKEELIQIWIAWHLEQLGKIVDAEITDLKIQKRSGFQSREILPDLIGEAEVVRNRRRTKMTAVVEVQRGESDHKHLGQLVSYSPAPAGA